MARTPEPETNEQPAAPTSHGGPAGSSSRKRPPPSTSPRRRRPSTRTLIDTAGPEPTTGLQQVRLTIGVIAGTHGVRGELKLKLLTDHPEHIPDLKTVYLGERDTPVRLLGARLTADHALIRLEGITNPEDGKRLGGLSVRIDATDAKPLDPGEYFIFQLIGLQAQAEDGAPLGTVTDLIETGANDVLVISAPSTPDLLVPNHPSYVLEIAPEQNRIVIRPPVYEN